MFTIPQPKSSSRRRSRMSSWHVDDVDHGWMSLLSNVHVRDAEYHL